MSRGFIYDPETDDNGEETLKSKIRHEMIQKLASEWNEYHQKIEQASWRDEHERADEADYHACMAEDSIYQAEEDALEKNPNLSKEEILAIRQKAEDDYYAEVKLQQNEKHLRIEVIEGLLSDLGARMMRPYEHWNEEERYMEYMENRYDNEY